MAVYDAVYCKELCVIHGPPGTGKTSTILEIILQYAKRNKRVVVTSPSNVAVDTIAERLIGLSSLHENLNMLRIGHPVRILESVIGIGLDHQIETEFPYRMKLNELKKEKRFCKSNSRREELQKQIDELENGRRVIMNKIFKKSNIFFATCVGAGFRFLKEFLVENNEFFDIAIIDEAAQALESSCFIPILMSQK
jgi:superfamily I DNA and/or RNA helicase